MTGPKYDIHSQKVWVFIKVLGLRWIVYISIFLFQRILCFKPNTCTNILKEHQMFMSKKYLFFCFLAAGKYISDLNEVC